MPIMVASDVISTGRRRTLQDVATASRTLMPSSRKCRANSTIRMLLDTAIPTSITTPIRDITFSVVPVSTSVSNTPVIPGGTASRMMKGSTKDRNWATRIRYSSTTARHRPMAKLRNEARIPCTMPRSVTASPTGTFVSAIIPSIAVAICPRSSPSGLT